MSGTESDASHWVLRPRRIGVFGGSRISRESAAFCRRLGWELAGEEGLVIVSGGFKCFAGHPEHPSADWSIVSGALARLRQAGTGPETRIETLLPEPDLPDVERFREGKTIVLHKRSLQARRFSLVNAADTLVAVEGDIGKNEMFELALAFEKPILPLPFTGGGAAQQWHTSPEMIRAWFDLDDAAAGELEAAVLADMTPEQIEELARKVKRWLLHQLRRKCFVIMPFAARYDDCYHRAIKPAIEACGMTAVRSDELSLVGDVMDVLRSALNSSACAVAVITGNNPNVMYELGLAHAIGKPAVLLCESRGGKDAFPELPYDLRNEFVIGYDDDLDRLREAILAVLKQLRGY